MTRVAIVTGASTGIGRTTADLLARRGWIVVGASRRGTSGAKWRGVSADVDDDASVQALVNDAIGTHRRIDAIVTAAGWGLAGPVETTDLGEARAQFETNFWGVVRCTTAVLPHMRENGGGRIVILSSIGGLIGIPFQAYYSASKFALEGWAESLAYEVAPFGICVTLIEPGNFRTDFTESRRRCAAPLGAYRDAAEHALAVMERDEHEGADPAAVAAVVAAQLEKSRPRRRVSVGRSGERIALVIKRLVPHRWFETLARGSLGVK